MCCKVLDLVDKFQVGASSSAKGVETSIINSTSEKTLEADKDGASPSSLHRDRSSPLRDALYKMGGGTGFTPNTTMNSTPKNPGNKERVNSGLGEGEVDEEDEFEDTQAEFDFSHVQFSSPSHHDQNKDKDEETEGDAFFSAQEGGSLHLPQLFLLYYYCCCLNNNHRCLH